MKDNLKTTMYESIITDLGGDISNLPVRLESTYLKAIKENLATNEQRGFEAGKKAENEAFWDVIQDYGNRTNYQRFADSWNCEYIRPKYKVIPTYRNSLNGTFTKNNSLKKVEAAYFDFSQKEFYASNSASNYYTFDGCKNLEEVEDIGIVDTFAHTYTFSSCPKLHTIAVVRFAEDTIIQDVFNYDYELQNLTIEGTIGRNGFNVQWSNKLTHDSLMSIINALKDYSDDTSGTDWVVKIGSGNYAKLTEEEILIAENKGWRIE